MASEAFQKGATSQSIEVYIQDSSTGLGKTGLLYNTSGLTAYYRRAGAADAAVTLATQTVTGAWSSGGFVEIDGTNMPGWYRFDVPDAVLATGVNRALVQFNGTGVVHKGTQLALTDYDPDAVDPNIAAIKAKTDNLPASPAGVGDVMKVSSGSGANQILLSSGQVTVSTNNDKAGYTASTVTDKTGYALTSAYDPAKTAAQPGDAMKISTGTGTGQLDITSGKVNLGKINGTTVNGDGSGTPWGP